MSWSGPLGDDGRHKGERGPMGMPYLPSEPDALRYALDEIDRYKNGRSAYTDSDHNTWYGLEGWTLILIEKLLKHYNVLLTKQPHEFIDWKGIDAQIPADERKIW